MSGDHQDQAAGSRYRATITWDVEDVDGPLTAAAMAWHDTLHSEGPVVEVTDAATGETTEVDLFFHLHGRDY